MAQKFKIKKGDQVVVTTGRDKGRRGEVIRVLREENRVLVQGCNMVKRHPRRHHQQGSPASYFECCPHRPGQR